MKKLTATILGVILVGTLVTTCGSEDETVLNNAGEPYVAQESQWDNRIQYTCMWWRDTVFNYSVMTQADADKAFKKVYGWSMDTALRSEGRAYYEAYLANDGDKLLAAGTTIGNACDGVPNP